VATSSTRVFIVDDHDVVIDGVRLQLVGLPDLELVGTASNCAQARARITGAAPDVVIVDVRLPDGSGIELIRDIRSSHPRTACLVFTSYGRDRALFESLVAGASGFLTKDAPREVLVESIQRAARGESLITREILDDLRARAVQLSPGQEEPTGLTPQERRILTLVTRGLTNMEIAIELDLAEKTIRNNVSQILAKLGMRNRTEVTAFVAGLRQNERNR
jgi:two-component system, NarL family, response regulator DevR